MNGSLQKKGNFYYAVISTKDVNGKNKTIWKSTSCKKKSEAQKVLNNLLVEMENGEYIDTNKMLFSDFMLYWLDNEICNQVEPTTLESYKINITKHIEPYFKERLLEVQQVKLIHLQKYFDDKYKSGLSANSLHKHYANMKKALDYAVKSKMIKYNPIIDVSLPKIKKHNIEIISSEDLKKLLEAVKDTPIETAVYLTANYGLRRGEVLGLRWKDIDFENKTVSICNTRTKMLSDVEKQPKTESSNRILPLIDNVAEYLLKVKEQQDDDKQFFGNCYNDCEYICRNKAGHPLSTGSYDHSFRSLLKANNLPLIRLHDLRHLNATMLLRQGISAKEIQVWLGHSQISTTLDIYTHVDFEMKKSSANVMNELIPNIIN